MDIKNLSVIVTGGGSGMGAQTAIKLAECGAKVAVLDINKKAVDDMANKISGIGIVCDVTSEDSVTDALKKVTEKHGAPRICINCAGIIAASRIAGRDGPMSLDQFRKVIDVNLIGTFNVMRLVADYMVKQEPLNDDGERGVIINTASIAAFEGQIGQAAYSASKGGVVSMTLPAAREFAKSGIRVMAIAPGLVATPMINSVSEKVLQNLNDSTEFPNRLGEPKEYAELVLHIISNAMLNGSVIRLDGAVRLKAK